MGEYCTMQRLMVSCCQCVYTGQGGQRRQQDMALVRYYFSSVAKKGLEALACIKKGYPRQGISTPPCVLLTVPIHVQCCTSYTSGQSL